jgi:hypothetical protein
LSGRTKASEGLAVEVKTRGHSTRDSEETLGGDPGRRLLGRATMSEITERHWAEYEAFTTRDLTDHQIVYVLTGGTAERLRPRRPLRQ